MIELKDTTIRPERAFLIGVQTESTSKTDAESLLRELSSLASTLGLEVVGTMIAHLRDKTPALLFGTGKADEIVAAARAVDADSILFDHLLSPSQQRNWEALSGLKAFDRAELIIRIFASRALTREASLQVELAQLEYSLPRLAHSYEALSRQRGGRYGTKGKGEQKIELDRREIERRLHEIKDELKSVRKSRDVQKRMRERQSVMRAAVVGYTNAGKSSLLNALSNADVFVEDKLFATLDPTTRRIGLTGGGILLLTDTVGFVRNLPHHLVEAFKATLEEAADADLLVHVADASDPEVELHMETTEKVLREIGAAEIPMILVLNKVDLVDSEVAGRWHDVHPDGIIISALYGDGLPALKTTIEARLSAGDEEVLVRLPHAAYALVALLHRQASVISETHEEESTLVRCRIPSRLADRFEPYRIEVDPALPE